MQNIYFWNLYRHKIVLVSCHDFSTIPFHLLSLLGNAILEEFLFSVKCLFQFCIWLTPLFKISNKLWIVICKYYTIERFLNNLDQWSRIIIAKPSWIRVTHYVKGACQKILRPFVPKLFSYSGIFRVFYCHQSNYYLLPSKQLLGQNHYDRCFFSFI